MNNFKIGDKVEFNTMDKQVIESVLSSYDDYTDEIKDYIGKIGIVVAVLNEGKRAQVCFGREDKYCFAYPYNILKKVNDNESNSINKKEQQALNIIMNQLGVLETSNNPILTNYALNQYNSIKHLEK